MIKITYSVSMCDKECRIKMYLMVCLTKERTLDFKLRIYFIEMQALYPLISSSFKEKEIIICKSPWVRHKLPEKHVYILQIFDDCFVSYFSTNFLIKRCFHSVTEWPRWATDFKKQIFQFSNENNKPIKPFSLCHPS